MACVPVGVATYCSICRLQDGLALWSHNDTYQSQKRWFKNRSKRRGFHRTRSMRRWKYKKRWINNARAHNAAAPLIVPPISRCDCHSRSLLRSWSLTLTKLSCAFASTNLTRHQARRSSISSSRAWANRQFLPTSHSTPSSANALHSLKSSLCNSFGT